MNTIQEIEHAIERLPPSQVEELAGWLEEHRFKPVSNAAVENWLQRACGAAKPGITTDEIMAQSRGDD